MSHLWRQLRSVWLSAGVPINPGVTPDAIERVENKRGIRLPQPLRDFLLTCNGMQDGLVDDELISFHPLEVIDSDWEWYERGLADDLDKEPNADGSDRKEPHRLDNFVDIVFADFCLDSHVYAVRISRDGRELGVWALDGTNSKRLAQSFEEFVAGYLSDPGATANPWSSRT